MPKLINMQLSNRFNYRAFCLTVPRFALSAANKAGYLKQFDKLKLINLDVEISNTANTKRLYRDTSVMFAVHWIQSFGTGL